MKEFNLKECEEIISESIYKNIINAKAQSFKDSCKNTPKVILDWQEELKAKWKIGKEEV